MAVNRSPEPLRLPFHTGPGPIAVGEQGDGRSRPLPSERDQGGRLAPLRQSGPGHPGPAAGSAVLPPHVPAAREPQVPPGRREPRDRPDGQRHTPAGAAVTAPDVLSGPYLLSGAPEPFVPLPRVRRGRAAHLATRCGPTHPVPHRDERSHRLGLPIGSAGRPRDARTVWEALSTRLGLAGVLALGAVLRFVGIGAAPGPSGAEADLVTRVVAFSRGGVWAATTLGDLPVRLASPAIPQFAALAGSTGAWGRQPSALGAVRESGPLLWVLTGLLVWLLARRGGVGRGWALGAVALLAVCPTAIDDARTAAPENLAAVWALAALVLACGRPRVGYAALRVDLGICLCLGLAVLTAPVAVTLLPAVLLLSARQRDPLRPVLLGVGLVAAIGLGVLITGSVGTDGPLPELAGLPTGYARGWFDSGWLGLDVVTPVLVLLAAALGLRRAGSRSLAVGVLCAALLGPLLGLLAGAPVGGGPVLAVPVAAVLLVAEAGAVLAESGRRLPRPAGLLPRLAPGLLAAALLLVWGINLAHLPGATAPSPASQARAWLADNVPGGEPVLADARSRVSLVPGTDAWSRVVTPDQCCGEPHWSVWTPSDTPPPAGATMIARFGRTATDLVSVSGLPTSQADQIREAGVREAGVRQAAGQTLLLSPQLDADPAAADALRDGRLDPRAMTALAGLLVDQRVRLVGLPPVPGELTTDRPARQMLLAPAAGPRTDPGTVRRAVVAFFEAQISPFRPDTVTQTPDGVLVRYSPLAPPDLLAAFRG